MLERATIEATKYLMTHGAEHIKGKVLDAGCGRQPYKRLFEHKVDEWVGYDMRPVGNVVGLIEQLDFPCDTFDCVLLTFVLEYLPDEHMAMAELARVLKPGGHIIIITPHSWPDDKAYRRYTVWGIQMLCEKAGLKMVHACTLAGFFKAKFEAFIAWSKFSLSFPREMGGFIGALDTDMPMLSVVCATKEKK